jgi:hypothetical protein
MERTQLIIIILLIIAIIFSAISMIMSISLGNFKAVSFPSAQNKNTLSGNPVGGVGINILPPAANVSGGTG